MAFVFLKPKNKFPLVSREVTTGGLFQEPDSANGISFSRKGDTMLLSEITFDPHEPFSSLREWGTKFLKTQCHYLVSEISVPRTPSGFQDDPEYAGSWERIEDLIYMMEHFVCELDQALERLNHDAFEEFKKKRGVDPSRPRDLGDLDI